MSNVTDQSLESPQEFAGFWVRFGASILDSILLLAITLPLLLMVYGSEYFTSENYSSGVADILISWVFPIVATILFWMYKSATPGKMVVKVKIVDIHTGNAPTVTQSLIRYIGYYISALPIGLGFFWVIWDAKKQGWHDKMAGTVVTRVTGDEVVNAQISTEAS